MNATDSCQIEPTATCSLSHNCNWRMVEGPKTPGSGGAFFRSTTLTLLAGVALIERILTVVGHSPLPCSLDHFTFGTQEIGSVYDILKRPLARRVLFSACRISGNSVTRISNLKKWFYKHAATIEYSNDNMGVLGRLLPLSFVPLLVLAASDPFVDGLNQLGLTSFAKLILAISQTKLGATLVQQLMTSTNYSIFVPTNEALAELDSNSTQDTNLVAAIASYHVIEGNYYRDHSDDKSLSAEVFPNVTIARTLLTDSGFVQLENGLGQVLIWGKDKDGSTKILNQPRETTVQSANLVVGYAVFPVNHVLQSPAWLSITLKNRTQGTTNALVTALQSTFVDIPDGKNKSLLTLFDDPGHFHGYTFLAPTDEAFAKVADVLPKLSADEVRNILLNHVINGTTLYSTTLAPGKAITGQETTFLANATGAYVTSGSVTAKITQTNALVRDGVVHTIDTVLTDVPKKGSGGGGSDGGSGKCKPKR